MSSETRSPVVATRGILSKYKKFFFFLFFHVTRVSGPYVIEHLAEIVLSSLRQRGSLFFFHPRPLFPVPCNGRTGLERSMRQSSVGLRDRRGKAKSKTNRGNKKYSIRVSPTGRQRRRGDEPWRHSTRGPDLVADGAPRPPGVAFYLLEPDPRDAYLGRPAPGRLGL